MSDTRLPVCNGLPACVSSIYRFDHNPERCDGLDDAKPASETEDLIEKGVPWATHLYIYFRERRRAASLHLDPGYVPDQRRIRQGVQDGPERGAWGTNEEVICWLRIFACTEINHMGHR